MTARSAATIASLVLVGAVSACTNFYEVPIETPISPKMDVSRFTRVLVAGFISGGTEDVDANLETVRLLRSQLRSKSQLRVIEADVLPLAEMATEQHAGTKPAATSESTATPAGTSSSAEAPATSTSGTPATPGAAAGSDREPRIRTEKDLEKYQALFANVEFWKKLGEEYQNPLIVTGTVLFTPRQTAGFVTQNIESYDNLGRRSVTPRRMYVERKGFSLTPTFIFIDGRTGVVLYRESLTQEVLYSPQQNTPALSSYFELMDGILPSFLGALSTQKIRGTRVLLR
jgi:hypothetical protein